MDQREIWHCSVNGWYALAHQTVKLRLYRYVILRMYDVRAKNIKHDRFWNLLCPYYHWWGPNLTCEIVPMIYSSTPNYSRAGIYCQVVNLVEWKTTHSVRRGPRHPGVNQMPNFKFVNIYWCQSGEKNRKFDQILHSRDSCTHISLLETAFGARE